MSIEDIKTKGISIRLGQLLHICTPPSRVITFCAHQLSEKTFNYHREAIYFFTSDILYILPYHKENYVEILENSGFERDGSLYIPLGDGISYPIEYKEKWESLMKESKETA